MSQSIHIQSTFNKLSDYNVCFWSSLQWRITLKALDSTLPERHRQVERNVVFVITDHLQKLKLKLIQRLREREKRGNISELEYLYEKQIQSQKNHQNLHVNRDIEAGANYFWVSGHEAVDVVVDLFEDEPSVHEGEAALVKTEFRLIQDTQTAELLLTKTQLTKTEIKITLLIFSYLLTHP